ncbi:MAG: permease [Deltaproteobacteria bacterium]|nr:permease [Deltaproteobacteria bacterium]
MKIWQWRYKWLTLLVVFNALLILIAPDVGSRSVRISLDNLWEMVLVVPPIFALLGLMDVWVPREIMMRLMGERSGWLGVLIAFVFGSLAAGPLYAAFPIAGILLKKGSKFSNVLIFIGAWSTTKIPLLLFESYSMGWKFMIVRLALSIVGIALMAPVIERALSPQDKERIYETEDYQRRQFRYR